MNEYDYVKEQLKAVLNRISDFEKAANRRPGEVKLIAVSKTFPAAAVKAAFEAGQLKFGENKVQELEEKAPVLPPGIEWHIIGHLQSNKALKAVTLASCIHSVDSVKLLGRLDRLAGENNKKPGILLEINISSEESKFGLTDEKETMRLAQEAVKAGNLSFKGLMTMAPFDADEHTLRAVFSGLRNLRDRIEKEFGVKLPELSMGMSSDFGAAVKEGATLVRIGTAIFGKRNSLFTAKG